MVSSADHDAFPGYAVVNYGGQDVHVIAYREGAGHTSTDGEIKVRRSTDGGATWSSAATVLTSASWDYRGASLTTLSDGRLVLVSGVRTSGGADVTDGGFTVISSDAGATWGTAARIDDAGFTSYSRAEGPVTELANGDWLLPIYGADTGDGGTTVRVLTSSDDGATWSLSADVYDGSVSGDYNEAGIIRSGDSLAILVRENTGDTGGSRGYKIHRATSSGAGTSWSSLTVVMNAKGGRPTPFVRSNGDVVMTVRDIQGESTYPEALAVSKDFGVTWVTDHSSLGGIKGVYGQVSEDSSGFLGVVWANEEASDTTADSVILFRREIL